jgi:hypothetical protein
MSPKHPPGPPMTLGNVKKLVIIPTLLVISASANAEN